MAELAFSLIRFALYFSALSFNKKGGNNELTGRKLGKLSIQTLHWVDQPVFGNESQQWL